MSFICIICHDLITTKGQNVDGTRGSDIVATKCGHLYHLNCLNEWVNTQDIPRQECPYCKSRIATNDYQRIFPSGDEETDEILNRYKDAKTQQKANGQLQEEIDERTEQLVYVQGKLEEERLFQGLLMYEHSLLMNRFSELKNHAPVVETRDINMTKELQQKRVKLEQSDPITLRVSTKLNQTEIKNTELKTKLGKQEKKTKMESEVNSLRSRDLTQSRNMERHCKILLQACPNGFTNAKLTTHTAAGTTGAESYISSSNEPSSPSVSSSSVPISSSQAEEEINEKENEFEENHLNKIDGKNVEQFVPTGSLARVARMEAAGQRRVAFSVWRSKKIRELGSKKFRELYGIKH